MVEVGDGIVKILGLRNAVSQEILKIETSDGARTALALSLEEESIGALVTGRLPDDQGRGHRKTYR